MHTYKINQHPEFKCPKCGKFSTKKENSITDKSVIGTLNITIEEFKGDYCLGCFAEWISDNIPMLEKI